MKDFIGWIEQIEFIGDDAGGSDPPDPPISALTWDRTDVTFDRTDVTFDMTVL